MVITPAVDPLSRDTTDLLVMARDMQRAGAGIRSLAEPFLDAHIRFCRDHLCHSRRRREAGAPPILERTPRGRADAKANGVKFGRKAISTRKAQRGRQAPRSWRNAAQRRPQPQCQPEHDFMAYGVMDTDLIRITQAHLRALWQVNFHSIDEYSLRVASAPLRFLLVEGNLVRAWKASGIRGPIQMETYCFVSRPGPDAIGFCGGGDILPGVPTSMSWGDVRLRVKRLNIDAFLNEPCICAKGFRITRRDLVQYIANTKGGAHYDPQGLSPKSRNKKFSVLRELEEGGFAGLFIKTNDRNLVHHELFSVTQSLLRSEQVQRLQTLTI